MQKSFISVIIPASVFDVSWRYLSNNMSRNIKICVQSNICQKSRQPMCSVYIKYGCSGAQRVNQLKTLNSSENVLIAIRRNHLRISLWVILFYVIDQLIIHFIILNKSCKKHPLRPFLNRKHYLTLRPRRSIVFFLFKFLSIQWILLRSVNTSMPYIAKVFWSKHWLQLTFSLWLQRTSVLQSLKSWKTYNLHRNGQNESRL